MTQAEIARQTGAPLGTVKSRVHLGLLALRDVMAPDSEIRPVAKSAPLQAAIGQLG